MLPWWYPRHGSWKREDGGMLQKKGFVILQAEKKEKNLSYTGQELHGRMWWAKPRLVLSDAERLFSEKQFPSSCHQLWHEAPGAQGVRSREALQR